MSDKKNLSGDFSGITIIPGTIEELKQLLGDVFKSGAEAATSKEALKKAFEDGFEKAQDECFVEIQALKKELEKPKLSAKGLYQVQYEGDTYELVSVGRITLGDRTLKASELIEDTELCNELLEQGSTLFQKVAK